MDIPALSRKVVAATALGVLAVSMTACSPNQPPASAPGTMPPVWTASSAQPAQPPAEGGPVPPESLTTHLRDADGTMVATAKFEFDHGYVTVTVATTGVGQLSPGFHGLHIHSVGKCEPVSVAPSGGTPGNFLSAGGHYQVPGHTGEPESGDLTSLQVRKDGAALLVTTTDAVTKDNLLSGDGTSIVIHAGPDNFEYSIGALHPGQRRTRTRRDHHLHR